MMERAKNIVGAAALFAALSGCSYDAQRVLRLAALSSKAPIGADYTRVKQALLADGYESRTENVFGPGRDFSQWDECLVRNIGHLLALVGGDRWVCVKLDSQGKIAARTVDEFVWGV